MSRSWNGLDLQTELSELLSDTSSSFKLKVLNWINEIQFDVAARHDWSFLRVKGQKALTANMEEQPLFVPAPAAPSLAQSSGGTLTDGGVYDVGITFVESTTGYETSLDNSASITISGATQQIDVTAIPVSTEPLVTSRNVYLRKDSGEFILSQSIADNTTTTATISSDVVTVGSTASEILTNESTAQCPPDYVGIRKLSGNPFLEDTAERQLIHKPLDQMRLLFGKFDTGTPEYWSDLGPYEVVLNPYPAASGTNLSYYYYKIPKRVFASKNSSLDFPPWLKPAIRAGVLARGYEYRDRSGQESKLQNYEAILQTLIKQASPASTGPFRIRDVVGDSDGMEI